MPARALPPVRSYEPALINAGAEASLLGALLSTNAHAEWMVEAVQADDFHDELHREIYRAAIERIDAGKTASPVTLVPLFSAEAAPYLAGLTGADSAFYAVREHAEIVADLGRRRRKFDELTAAAAEVARPGDNSLDDIIGRLDLSTVSAGAAGKDDSYSLADLVRETRRDLEDEAAGKTAVGIKVDFIPDHNDVVGGDMRGGELIIVGARPGMGKTAYAITLSLGSAANDHGTLVISREMRAKQLGRRIIADLIFDHGVSPKFDVIKKGRFSQFDRDALDRAERLVSDWPWYVTDSRRVTVDRLGSTIRRYKRMMAAKGKTLKLVVIDYLQLLRAEKSRSKVYEEISDVSRMLKALALDEDVTILALAQLSREVEKREDKRPVLSDLRDSGQIEQDADAVIFLYREEYYLQQHPKRPEDKGFEAWEVALQGAADRLEVIGAKVRDGALMRRNCWFFADRQAVRGSRYFEERRVV